MTLHKSNCKYPSTEGVAFYLEDEKWISFKHYTWNPETDTWWNQNSVNLYVFNGELMPKLQEIGQAQNKFYTQIFFHFSYKSV